MDWTEDADLRNWFKDWREEPELLLNTVLSHIGNQKKTLKFVSLWAEKKASTYLNTVDQDKKDSLKTMLDALKNWTRPKSDEAAVFTQLRTLIQSNIHSRSEESGRSMQFQLCGRLQGQADQKFNCGRPQQYQSISAVYFKGVQSHPG